MGNIFHSARPHRRESEIQFEYFNRTYNAVQYPKNLHYPQDLELYSITNKLNQKVYTLKRVTFFSEEALQYFLDLLEYIITLRHPNLLAIENYFVQKNYMDDTIISYSVNIIMENFNHTLREEIIAHQKNQILFSEDRVYQLMIDMTEALKFLQLKSFWCGFICPSNIFITSDNKFKLCFVGELFFKTESGINPNLMLFVDYMAPKLRTCLTTALLNGSLPEQIKYDKYKSDVFSLGIVMLQMISLKDIQSLNTTGSEVRRLNKAKDCTMRTSMAVLDLLKAMLAENEHERPDCVELAGLISIQQDEISELAENYKRERRSFITQFHIAEAKKPHQIIELKEVPKPLDDKDHDYSEITSEFITISHSKTNQQSETPNFTSTYDDHFAQCIIKSFETVSLSDKYLSRMHSNIEDHKYQKRISEKEKKENKVLETQLDAKELFIDQEEDLFNLKFQMVGKLIIKLKGQPKHKNLPETVADLISKQKFLQELVIALPDMSLGNQGVTSVIHSLLGLDHLRIVFLELRKDKITAEVIKDVGLVLQDKLNLEQVGIDLSSNSLTDEVCRELVNTLQNLEHIKFLALNLGGNNLSNESLKKISGQIGKLKLLENLVLFMYSNQIDSSEALITLVANINKLEKLSSLSVDISDNLVRDEGSNLVLEFLKGSQIKNICWEMQNNCMSDHMHEVMKKEIKELKHIRLSV